MRTKATKIPLSVNWNKLWMPRKKKPETWKLEDYLKGTGHWKYHHRVVEPLEMECPSLNYFLVLMIQRYLQD
jgi:hypothetical protein